MNEEINTDFVFKIGLFLVAAIIYYIIRKDSGEYFINKGLMEIFVFGALYMSSQSVIWYSRSSMPQVTVNGHSGSILGSPAIVTDKKGFKWAIFNTGYSLLPFPMKGKLGTLVVPLHQLNRSRDNYIAKTFVKPTPKQFLPPAVYNYLIYYKSDYNLDKIYFGMHSEEFYHKDPTIDAASYEQQIENLQSQINLRDDILAGRNDILIEMNELAKEMSGNRFRFRDMIGRNKNSDEE